MLEGLASWILKTYIGKYINVNQDKLSIGLLSGVVELENVPLKPEAFNQFDFPFELKYGLIDKIKLNISLNTLRYSPWSFLAENLMIIIGPKKLEKQNQSENESDLSSSIQLEEKEQKEKLEKLVNLENKWFKEVELLGIDDDINKSERQSLFFKLLAPMAYSVLNNIQFSLNGLHIRYEDEQNKFSLGTVIEQITIKNDSEYSNNLENLSSKLFELKNFSFYFDKNLYFNQSPQIEINLFQFLSQNSSKFDYIISPTCFKTFLIRDLSTRPIRKRKKPRIRIKTILNDFNLTVSQNQLNYLNYLNINLNIYKNFLKIKSIKKPAKFEAKSYWLYLTKCVLVQIKKPNFKDLIKWAYDVNLYNKALTSQYCMHQLDTNLLEHKNRIEKEWDFKRLLTLRRTIFECFVKSPSFKLGPQLNSTKQTSFNYLNVYGYISWRLTNYFNRSVSKPDLDHSVHNEIDDEVIGIINDTIENDSLFKRDSLLAVLEFKLEKSEICLSNQFSQEICKFKLEQSQFIIEALPRYESYSVELTLGSFYLIDCFNKNTCFPNLVYSKQNESLFNLFYEHKPLNKVLNFRSNLTIKSSGFDVIYNKDLYKELLKFLNYFTHLNQESNEILFNSSLINMSKKSQLKLEPVQKINFNFEIIAPKFIIPENCSDSDSNCLVLDFGKFLFKNKIDLKNILVNARDKSLDEESDEDNDEEFATPIATPPDEFEFQEPVMFKDYSNFYSNYDLNLNNLQVLSGNFSSVWSIQKPNSNLYLLEKFDILIKIGLYKFKLENITDDSVDWSPIKIQIDVNLLKLNIDDLKLINLYKTYQNLNDLFVKKQSKLAKKSPNKTSFFILSKQFLKIDLNLNEVDVTMSTSSRLDLKNHKPDPRSICELKIYMITSTINLNSKFDVNFNLSIYNMLLIDARQIYGSDYQLLAASHDNILLDTTTGIIINRLTGLKEDLSKNTKPLINIDLNLIQENELTIDFSFSTLDIVLNPETISEIIILIYSVYLNISVNKSETNELKLELNEENTRYDVKSMINFKFKRLSVLLFRIEDDDLGLARKIALFALDGVCINACLVPEIKYYDVVSQINGFNITDLSQNEQKPTLVFGIGVQTGSGIFFGSESRLFDLNFKKLNYEKELSIKIASLCYLHSPKLIDDIQSCLKDFKRFHVKIMEEVAEKAANLAFNMLRKGKIYLENKLAEMYDNKPSSSSESKSKLKIKISLESPVISIPVLNSKNSFFVAHLGQIKIKNLEDFDTTKFSLLLKDMHMFSINEPEPNDFRVFYDPSNKQILIDKTDILLNLTYLPNIDTGSNKKINGGYLNIMSKLTNTCQINLSKSMLELLTKISDSIIYREEDQDDKIDPRGLNYLKTKPISFRKNSFRNSMAKSEENQIMFENFSGLFDESSSDSDNGSSSEPDEYVDDEKKLDRILIDIWFKIEKLEIKFLADVEEVSQEIAELSFHEYELNINKSEEFLTSVKMSLKSLYLVDKLVKNTSKDNYLLWSDSDLVRNHKCLYKSKSNSNTSSHIHENISFSAPSLGKNLSLFKYYRTKKSRPKKPDFINNIFELKKFYNCLSTSLPSNLSSKTKPTDKESKDKNNHEHEKDDCNQICPATPPSSPTANKKFILKSESMANMTPPNQIIPEQGSECQLCDSDPLVKISLLLIDDRNPFFSTKYKCINRLINIKFSRLKLTVNPESWILVLDLLGLGSKAYPIVNSKSDYEGLNSEKKASNGIKFKVEQFTIQLNEAESRQKLVKFKINKVKAFIESRADYIKSNGKLGSCIIYDVSPHKGLYTDRFLTSGDQALEFEFFKHIGPLDLLEELHDFDMSLKLNMSSVKYVHTQRFIITITSYFQQFNQLQDALGKMRAISSGQKNISYKAQRSSRIKLDIQTEAPIIVIPLNNKSNSALVFNLGNIEIKNRFLMSTDLNNSISSDGSNNNSFCMADSEERDCMLDLIDIKFTDVHLYSALRYANSALDDLEEEEEDYWDENFGLNQSSSGLDNVKFFSFYFKQFSNSLLKQSDNIYFHLERNLENELSHKSPDWYVFAKLSSVLIKLDLEQYKLIRGVLDQNIGEQVKQNMNQVSSLIIPNPGLETVLTGRVWKQISLNFDLENVHIELQDEIKSNSISFASLIKSNLIYESFSDGSKLIDLVSNEILINDTRTKKFNVLTKKKGSFEDLNSSKSESKRLQLEVHYRSNKNCNRYSVLFNNCRVIGLIDWLMEIKAYLMSYANPNEFIQKEFNPSNQPMEVKLNLTNTDFVLVENIENENSQAIILRLTAFFEYNERKLDKQPIECCLQSLELFSCQMNAIEQTALSIIDPVMFNIYLKAKNSNELKYLLEISSEKLRLRFSYLDFKLFIKVIKSVQKQIEKEKKIEKKLDLNLKNVANKPQTQLNMTDLNLWMSNFSICIIDDCNDIDIPLLDIQFNRLALQHQFKLEYKPSVLSEGSVEFVLNVDYYNRLLSGWEPLLEPWLARLNWKFKLTTNVFTLTSMDVLNLNLTNPFLQMITNTLTNWKTDFNDNLTRTKMHKIFQPYKLVNLTGEKIEFLKYSDLDSEWLRVEDKNEIEFNFFKTNSNYPYSQRTHNNQIRKIVQNRIKIRLDNWAEVRALTIDKVGTYFRDIYRLKVDPGPETSRLIFDISLKQNATKLIEIKSPVTIKNLLNTSLECFVESAIPHLNSKFGPLLMRIETNEEISVPIKYLPCLLKFRLLSFNSEFSASSLNLENINQPGQIEYTQLTCLLKNTNKILYFFARIKKLNFPDKILDKKNMFGHSILIEPAFSLYNLLPVEFRYKFLNTVDQIQGKIDSNKLENFTNINVSNPIEFTIDLDNFMLIKPIDINPSKQLSNSNIDPAILLNRKLITLKRVNFVDEQNRPLFLIARIMFKIGSSVLTKFSPCPIVLHISAVYCFFNLTGLPLIFRQYNCDESAGQLEEHESVCNNQPLLFSFNDVDSPYACSMRIGRNCIDFREFILNDKKSIMPKWCKPFGLDSGSSFRALQVVNNHVSLVNNNQDSYLNPDWVYYIGIEIKPGKGLFKDTTFVYFSTRYYLVNKSTNDLLISQYYFVKELREKGVGLNWNIKKSLSTNEVQNSILLLKDSMSQFHWPRADFDQLLSVRLHDDLDYNWSGGFKIDQVESNYINFRHLINTNEYKFIKCEIFLDGGTFYIVFSDKIDFPFPIRIENMSEVPVYFYQPNTLEEKFNIFIKPKQTINYTWDEQILEKKLTIGVKGGTSTQFDLNQVEESKNLFYENFFYIVFSNRGDETNTNLLNSQELVLTFLKNRIFLDYKEPGNRSQLWSLTTDGYLVHEGSSPPRDIGHNTQPDLSTSYVLDIEELAPRPNHLLALTLRRPDLRRKNTQRWSFDQNGHLCCNVRNMCLQVKELRKGFDVYLGPILSNQVVIKQQLRPGSGYLSVNMNTDGPTRVIKIANIRNKSYMSINWEKADTEEDMKKKKSIEVYVNLTGGVGVSIVHWKEQEYEELIYCYLNSIELTYDQDSNDQKFLLGIQSIQICNQLLNASRQNLIYTQTNLYKNSDNIFKKHELALKIDFKRKFRSTEQPIYIEHLIIDLLDVNLQIEERLLWKLIEFLGLAKFDSIENEGKLKLQGLELIQNDSIGINYYKNQLTNLINDSQATKYNFNKFQINDINMILSVYKTPKLSSDLLKIKSSLGIPLIQFENAFIECKAFILINEHDTISCILKLITNHYTQELRSHAIRILGSVDFLGNPLGLMVDFKESFSNILSNGHVTDFVFSITHGVANSVSKFSGSLSDELNGFTMDERHQETREQIRSLYNNGSFDHFVGGAIGFAVGIFGGAISLATQTYRGFNEAGVSGALSGLGRGAVGTVSKPIVGMLDFATGIASAIKETSKTINKMEIPRVRESRCCSASGALLSQYSRSDANGQKILYQVNNFNLGEKFIAMEQMKNNNFKYNPSQEQSIAMVTNQRVLFIKSIDFDFRIDYEYTYEQLKSVSAVEDKDCAYLELFIENELNSYPFVFENKSGAKSLENKIRYAKADFDETFYILHNYKEDEN